MKLFPLQVGNRGARAFVPWWIVAKCAERCDTNHSQTVERLAERGGLSPCELAAVLEDRRWHEMNDDDAWAVIQGHIALALTRAVIEECALDMDHAGFGQRIRDLDPEAVLRKVTEKL